MNFSATAEKRRNRKMGSRVMEVGDTVIIYERYDSLSYLCLHRGRIHDNKFGTFHHNDFIGKPFGSRIYSKGKAGWVYALEPSPELWSHAMHTRTQIVDESDASYVTFMLDVYPGCKVIESGTGSGNMSLSLARAVSPNGHVYSFEYNATRAQQATAEFESLGVSHLLTVQCRDVCGTDADEGSVATSSDAPDDTAAGGGFGDLPVHSIDAVFLDLPKPWLALTAAKRALKPGKNICCYSPCMEQVIRTCEELRQLGFHSIRMMELRQRPFEGRAVPVEVPDLGRREEAEGAVAAAEGEECAESQRIDGASGDMGAAALADKDEEGELTQRKRRKRNAYEVKSYPPKVHHVARAVPTMKGHTAYLTFAVAPADAVPTVPGPTQEAGCSMKDIQMSESQNVACDLVVEGGCKDAVAVES